MKKPEQLALNICLRDDMTFENFFNGSNSKAVAGLQKIINSDKNQFAYIWGGLGAGKTHLLLACCNFYIGKKLSTLYLSLSENAELEPAILEDIEHLELIAIDDMQLVIGQRDWEEALFRCFNEVQTSGKKLIIAANATAQSLPFILPDLKSRLASDLILRLDELTDEEKVAALIWRAKLRGIELTSSIAKFLLRRYPRDTTNLFALLDRLDKAALQHKRALTLPFVKEILKNNC
jgi:DnaA-homolog protein